MYVDVCAFLLASKVEAHNQLKPYFGINKLLNTAKWCKKSVTDLLRTLE